MTLDMYLALFSYFLPFLQNGYETLQYVGVARRYAVKDVLKDNFRQVITPPLVAKAFLRNK